MAYRSWVVCCATLHQPRPKFLRHGVRTGPVGSLTTRGAAAKRANDKGCCFRSALVDCSTDRFAIKRRLSVLRNAPGAVHLGESSRIARDDCSVSPRTGGVCKGPSFEVCGHLRRRESLLQAGWAINRCLLLSPLEANCWV